MLWSQKVTYQPEPYANEASLEAAIRKLHKPLFGHARIYVDVKKKIGGTKKNIPDGYLIDLSSRREPRLYVVEVELARHEPIKHIAVQILEFSLAFESEPQTVKRVLREALDADAPRRALCQKYAKENGFDNVDYLLERMIYDGGFGALVIIDELVEELEAVLVKKFKFGVDVLEVRQFVGSDGEHLYEFEPFFEDVEAIPSGGPGPIDPAEIDMIVVPARPDGFERTFLGENRWHHIRIHAGSIARIKYIAAYVTAPTSAITHWAPVRSIEQWKDTGKYVVNFAEPAKEIAPIKVTAAGRGKAPQGPRYTSMARLREAKKFEDL